MNALFIKGIFHFKNYSLKLFKKTFENRRTPIGKLDNCCIFVSVFHRILDFKNGAGFLSWPHFFYLYAKNLSLNTHLISL